MQSTTPTALTASCLHFSCSYLVVTVGAADGSYTGKRIFATNVNGTLSQGYAWPLSQVLAILKLGMSSSCVMQISARGALQISVDSGIAKYDYILPALTV